VSEDAAPLQGDEEAVFARYSARLRRLTQLSVHTSRDIVDDACAFAWAQFLRHQPRRETVARREALRLDAIERGVDHAVDDAEVGEQVASARRTQETTHEMLELRERLAELPLRERTVLVRKAMGWSYEELARELGVSRSRIDQLLSRAASRMREMDIQEQDLASPRARRLREIELAPPAYIRRSIGQPPRPDPKHTSEDLRREWKRLVLAIEDYRVVRQIHDTTSALGTADNSREWRVLHSRITSFRHARGLSAELEL
jgi:RNA polymerase sigma factor (sigma-70 family)